MPIQKVKKSGAVEAQFLAFLTSETEGDKLSTTRPGYAPNKEHPAATIEYEAWMSVKARLDASKDTRITPRHVVTFLAKRIGCCGKLYMLLYRLIVELLSEENNADGLHSRL